MGTNCCKSADPNSVGGKSMIFLPFFLRSRIIESIDIAERLKGSPPSNCEVYVVMKIHFRTASFGGYGGAGWFNAFMQNLYREDLFYADKLFTYWTTHLDGEK
jgi:hypothetical protein